MPEPTSTDLADAGRLWDFLRLDDLPDGPTTDPAPQYTLALVLGSHDLAPAGRAAQLFGRGRVAALVCTGATSRTTAATFPQGEAAAFAAEAVRLGVPPGRVFREDGARSTVENVVRSRRLVRQLGLPAAGLILVGKPYQLRYARAVTARLWPGPVVRSTAERVAFREYAERLGPARVVGMLVGDLQRVAVVSRTGLAAAQPVPTDVGRAWGRLVAAGHTDRLIPGVPPALPGARLSPVSPGVPDDRGGCVVPSRDGK
ncbi:YdcF family protein [Nakamurella flava]|uniref:YdcF family protein n=1 Tax=Nakamurella flava TaxID=2576308 RepID=A0A4U6QEE6_9ACTN|nr:ElyC/SanA/YdcF family protein [Nakamurella flava]TKV58470.1 YdcF family protein [Nakamurella flava]